MKKDKEKKMKTEKLYKPEDFIINDKIVYKRCKKKRLEDIAMNMNPQPPKILGKVKAEDIYSKDHDWMANIIEVANPIINMLYPSYDSMVHEISMNHIILSTPDVHSGHSTHDGISPILCEESNNIARWFTLAKDKKINSSLRKLGKPFGIMGRHCTPLYNNAMVVNRLETGKCVPEESLIAGQYFSLNDQYKYLENFISQGREGVVSGSLSGWNYKAYWCYLIELLYYLHSTKTPMFGFIKWPWKDVYVPFVSDGTILKHSSDDPFILDVSNGDYIICDKSITINNTILDRKDMYTIYTLDEVLEEYRKTTKSSTPAWDVKCFIVA